MNRFTLLLFPILLVGCTSKVPDKPKAIFNVHIHNIDAKSMIVDAAMIGSDHIFRTEDQQIIILNSTFHHKPIPEQELSNKHINTLCVREDTVWVENSLSRRDSLCYAYLTNTCSLVKVKRPHFLNNIHVSTLETIYADSNYIGFEGCAGEFGGTIFFYDKHEDVTYSFPSSCPYQILKKGSEYIVIENLDHLGLSTRIISVKDPGLLYPTPMFYSDSTHKHTDLHVNWWADIDSIRDKLPKLDSEALYERYGVGRIDTSTVSETLIAFVYNNELFSIRNNDTNYIILKHQPGKTDTIQSIQLKHKNAHIHPLKSYTAHGQYSSIIYTSKTKTDGNMTHGYNDLPSDVIFIEGNTINVLRFDRNQQP